MINNGLGHWQISMVDVLSMLMILTATLITEETNLRRAVYIYVVQTLLLASSFLVIGVTYNWLILWAISAVVTKATICPYFILRAISHTKSLETEKPLIPSSASFLSIAILIVLSLELSRRLSGAPTLLGVVPLAVSLTLTMIGLLTIVTRRNIIKHILGLLHFENGAHLNLAVLAFQVPETVEMGIITDAVVLVFILALLATKIYKQTSSQDVSVLTTLKYS